MKICPVCSTTYADDSMRFCTKDGTTLVSMAASTPPPAGTPFAPLDETLSNLPPPPPRDIEDAPDFQREKFIVAVDNPQQVQPLPPPPPPPVQPLPPDGQQPPPKRKSNAAVYAVLGILAFIGILGVAGIAGAYWYFSQPKEVATANTNSISDSNSNSTNSNRSGGELSNLDLDISTNTNVNANTNLNANVKPSPSPSPSPKPSPSPSPKANTNQNQNDNTDEPPPRPSPTPNTRPSPANPQVPSVVSGGVVNGKATSLPKPAYPAIARAAGASGAVNVQVLIDERGNVVSASATSGHPLLRPSAVQAARQAKFAPTNLSGQAVKVSGVIVYNFILN